MKPKTRLHFRRNLATLGAFLVTMTAATAANLYWDVNYTGAGSGNSGGNWQGGNWNATQDGTGIPGPWIDGSSAIFSAGTDGNGTWAVDLGATVTVASIKFAQTGTKTINAGGTINIGGGSIDSTALGFAPGNGDDITINTILAGSGGLTIAAHGDYLSNNGGGGPAELRLNGDNTFSGGLTITAGLVSWTKDTALGNAANVITLNGGGLLHNGGGTLTSPRSIKIGAAGGTLRMYGSNNLVLTQPVTNAAGVASATLRRTDGGILYLPAGGAGFTGTFINGAASTQLNSVNADWSKTDFTVAGGNIVFNGTGTAVVKSIKSSADVIVSDGTTLNVNTGNILMEPAQHRFWTNSGQLGKLTSSTGTLNITTGVATGDLTESDHQIQTLITNSGATAVKLVKNNQNQLILTQPNTYSGGTTINGGRLEARDAGAFGTGAVTVVNGAQAFLRVGGDYKNNFILNGIGITEAIGNLGAMRVNGGASISGSVNIASASRITAYGANDQGGIAGALTGSAALEKTGAGTVFINGDGSGYTGPITVAAGRLRIGGSLGGSVTVADNASIAGEGTIAGGLTLGSGVNSQLYVDGSTAEALRTTALTVNGVTYVYLTALPVAPGTPINIIKYTGALTLPGPVGDAFQLGTLGAFRGAPTFANTGSAITLTIPAGANLVWRGEDPSLPTTWDIDLTKNWKNGVNNADVFFNGDNVLFDDTGVSKTVLMSGLLSPGTVTITNSIGNDYNITPNGAGFGFTGATNIVKNGEGTATIEGYGHDYTGTVTINGGILQPNANFELLGRASSVTINNGGQLNINGQRLGAGVRHYSLTIAGEGPDGLGAITNTSATGVAADAGLLNLTLAGNSSVGGNGGRFDIGRSGDSEGFIKGNGFTLTKVGSGNVTMRGPATNITYVVDGGSLKFENFDSAAGVNPIQVNAGALQAYGIRVFANVVNLAGGTALENDGGGTQFWTGPINLTGNVGETVRIGPRGGPIQLPGVISGDSNIEVINDNLLYLIGNVSNTYNGETRVTGNGQLILNKSGGKIAIPGDLVLASEGTRSITSTIADNQLAPGSVLRFAGAGDSRLELKGTTQTVGGLDYAGPVVGYKAIQHSEFGTPLAVDGISDLIINVAEGEYYEYAGVLRNQGGIVNVAKKGLGDQLLNSTLIDYTGSTTVTEGRLILRSDDTHSTAIAISAGATWEVNVITGTLVNRGPGLTVTGAGTYLKSGIAANSMGWSGGASVAMSSGGLINVIEGTLRLEYGSLTTWTNNKGDLEVAGGAIFDLWDSSQNVIVDSLDGGGLITRTNGNAEGTLTLGVDNGSGVFFGAIANPTGKTNLVKVGTGTQELGGNNTYTGNTTVTGGTLHLNDMSSLRFALTSGSSNQVTGTGTVIIDGLFDIDTSAMPNPSGTWTLVNTATLTTTFGPFFSPGFGWTDDDNDGKWVFDNGTTTGTFSEATGVLTLNSGASYASWIDGFFPGITDPNIIGADADPDGDGIANAVELMVGGNPATGMDAKLMPTLELVKNPAGVPAGDYLLFTYRRSGTATAAGLVATSQYDADLVGPWTTAQDGVGGVVVQVDVNYASFDPAATNTDRVRVYIPRGANPKLFGRLSVTVPGAPAAR